MPIKLKKSDIKDKLDNPKAGYMILGFDEKGELVWKDEDGNYGSVVPSATIGNYDVLQVKQYLTVGYRLVGANTGLYSIAHGSDVAASGESSYAQGMDAEADGLYSTAKGINIIASGDYAYVNGAGQLSLNKLESGGVNSFVHSFANTSNPSGTWSDYSVILGGTNHFISTGADNSVILGGSNHGIDMDTINSVIIGGIGNSINSSLENVAIIACNNVVAPISDAVYMPRIVLSGGTGLSSPIPGTIVYDSVSDNFLSYTASFPGGTALGGVYQSTLTPLSMTVKAGGVGGISDTTTLGQLTGKTYTYLFDSLLFPTQYPTYTIPTISMTGVAPTTLEVGTTYTASISVYGIKNDAGAYTQLRVLRNGSPISTQSSFTVTTDSSIPPQYGFTDPNNPNLRYTLTAPYSESYVLPLSTTTYSSDGNYLIGSGKRDNTGVIDTRTAAVRTTTAPQAAGSNYVSSSYTILATRRWWWGTGAAGSAPTNSSGVRALTNTGLFSSVSSTAIFYITIPALTRGVWFFIPAGKTVNVWYVDSNADVTGTFGGYPTIPTILVKDASLSTDQTYESWVTDIGGSGYPLPGPYTYRVTIT